MSSCWASLTSVNRCMDHLPSSTGDLAAAVGWAWSVVDLSADDVAAAFFMSPEQALRIKAIVADLLFELVCGARQ